MVRHCFYHELSRGPYPEHARKYWREQASRGLTAGTLSGNDTRYFDPDPAVGLAMMIDAVMDEGLAKSGQPLLILSDTGKTITDAREQGSGDWPEIILCGMETPNMADLPSLQGQANDAHEHGLRFGCTICATAAMDKWHGRELGSVPDIWIVQGSTFRESTPSDAASLGKELWSYFCNECYDKPVVLRYYAGLWAWARQVTHALLWAYSHHVDTKVHPGGHPVYDPSDKFSYACPREDGTIIPSSGYLGFEQGIQDCRLLEAAEASEDAEVREYVAGVRASVAYPMFRRLVGGAPVDMDEVARRLNEMGITVSPAMQEDRAASHARAKKQSLKSMGIQE
jgi:hypothetical protein